MKYHYVAFEREYGSGGTGIGQRLSELSGLPCHGSDILERVSQVLGLAVDQIDRYEEKATNSLLYSLYLLGQVNGGARAERLSNEGVVYLEEQKIIKDYAAHGPAIFVGRCAVNALADRKDVLRVFIRADKVLRLERAITSYGIPLEDAESTLQRFDRKRSRYYSANTGRDWRDWSNYDLILDSGTLGIDACARAVLAAMRG